MRFFAMCALLSALALNNATLAADAMPTSYVTSKTFDKSMVEGNWSGEWRGKFKSGRVWINIRPGRSEITADGAGTWEVVFRMVNADPDVRTFTLNYVGDENLQYYCRLLPDDQMRCNVNYLKQKGDGVWTTIRWSTAELTRTKP